MKIKRLSIAKILGIALVSSGLSIAAHDDTATATPGNKQEAALPHCQLPSVVIATESETTRLFPDTIEPDAEAATVSFDAYIMHINAAPVEEID